LNFGLIPVRAGIPRRTPIVAWMLIGLNVAVWIYMVYRGSKFYNYVIEVYGLTPAYIVEGRALYTILTSMFIHGDIMHLIGNMLYLWVFGGPIESRIGHRRFFILYIASGIFASIAHTFVEVYISEPIILYGWTGVKLIDPKYIPSIGASGAISGILGAYLVLLPASSVRIVTMIGWIPIVISIPAALFIAGWFLYQLYAGILSVTIPQLYFSGVAFWAHIGGFIAGLIMGLAIKPRRMPAIIFDYRR